MRRHWLNPLPRKRRAACLPSAIDGPNVAGKPVSKDGELSTTSANAASFDQAADDVFSRIASRYDLLCDLFSVCIHRAWKRRMAGRIAAARWERMLDVAAGTGDIALRVA